MPGIWSRLKWHSKKSGISVKSRETAKVHQLSARQGYKKIIKQIDCDIFRSCFFEGVYSIVTAYVPTRVGPPGNRAPHSWILLQLCSASSCDSGVSGDAASSQSKPRQHQRLKQDPMMACLERLPSAHLHHYSPVFIWKVTSGHWGASFQSAMRGSTSMRDG